MAAAFKMYVDTKCNFKKIHINDRDRNTSYTKKYQNHIPCCFIYELALMINLVNQLFFTEGKMEFIN